MRTKLIIGRTLLLAGFGVAVGYTFHNFAAGVAAILGVNILTVLADRV